MRVSTHAPPHSVWPAVHAAAAHWLSTHDWPVAQARPQPPQCWASVAVVTHCPPHTTWPEGHTHAPARHTVPPAQATPMHAASVHVPW
jgi:hypothetical protein